MQPSNLGKLRIRRLTEELKLFDSNPPNGLSLYPLDEAFINLEAQIEPSKSSLYSGQTFKCQITIPENFPYTPPIFKFVTPIFHPNIDTSGRICLDILGDNFNPCMKMVHLLTSIQGLLDCPNFDDPLRPEVAHIFKHNQTLYNELAKINTWVLPDDIILDGVSKHTLECSTNSKKPEMGNAEKA